VSRYLDGIGLDDLSPDQAGIRARRRASGGEVLDWVIAEESVRGMRGWVNLIGIDSPGLTACLAIGDAVTAMLVAA
jgi:hypothetical protein